MKTFDKAYSAVRDAAGITHRVRAAPETFSTREGGLPGQTMCVKNFYYGVRGPTSCSWPGAASMDAVDEPVDCMTCLVREARR